MSGLRWVWELPVATETKALPVRKLLLEARTWMERANEPDDEQQTKEQYRLLIMEEIDAYLRSDGPERKEG